MARIKQRQVFYIHGFDPRGAGHYHRLYRDQSAQQAKVNGLHIDVSKRRRGRDHAHHWQLNTEHTRTLYTYLGWDDIIRNHWAKGWREIIGDLCLFLWAYILPGHILTYAKASPKQMMAGFYPLLYLLLSTLLSGWLALSLGALLPWQALPTPLALPAEGATALMLFALLMQSCKALGNKLAVFWLLRIYAFSTRWSKGRIPELEPRIHTFAEHIAEAINNKANNEIVIVAHSVGTMVVIPALTQALKQVQHADQLANRRVVLITLGQCIPLLSFKPEANDFRAALGQLAHNEQLLWLDYTAPTDGACFPLLNPVTSCGQACAPNAGPRLLSPRFFTLYHPARYKKLRRAWYTMHFLYLMATDKAGAYDYFAFTAGPDAIATRLKERS